MLDGLAGGSAGEAVVPSSCDAPLTVRHSVLLLQVAFIGFAVQALASRTQPIEGLLKHLGNPGYNITYTLTHL